MGLYREHLTEVQQLTIPLDPEASSVLTVEFDAAGIGTLSVMASVSGGDSWQNVKLTTPQGAPADWIEAEMLGSADLWGYNLVRVQLNGVGADGVVFVSIKRR